RHRGSVSPLGARLSGRRAVGRRAGGQGVVREDEVPPVRPAAAHGSADRAEAAGALRRSGFLIRPVPLRVGDERRMWMVVPAKADEMSDRETVKVTFEMT